MPKPKSPHGFSFWSTRLQYVGRVFFAVWSSLFSTPVIPIRAGAPAYARYARKVSRLAFAGFILITLLGALGLTLWQPAPAHATNSDTINFQARLMGSDGGIADDGTYDVVFNIYSAPTGGTSLWTEDDATVRVADGYLTVNLGATTAFPSNMPWDQSLYLTMNVNSDGEMTPRLQLTAVPFAFQAANATTLQATSGSNVGTLHWGSITHATDDITLPDATGTICLEGDSAGCGFAAANGTSGAYIQNTTSLQTNANFFIQSTGIGTPTAVIEKLTGQTSSLLEFQDDSGNPTGGFNASGNLFFQSGSNASTLVQNSLTGAHNPTFELPDIGGTQVICTVATCTGGAGGSLGGSGTQYYVAEFDSAGNAITDSSIYDDGTFVGIGTTTTTSGRLSVVSDLDAAQSGVYIQGADNATAPVAEIRLGTTPGVGGSLIDFRDSTGALLATFSADGSLLTGATATVGSATTLGGNTGQLNVQAAGGSALGAVIRAGSGQTGNLLDLQDSSGATLSGFNHLGQLFFYDATNNHTGTISQDPLVTTDINYVLPDTGNASETICLVSTCTGGAGGSLAGTGTTNYVARWTGSNSLGKGLLYDTGTGGFVGVNTTTDSGELSIQSGAAGESALAAFGAASSTVPVAVITGGATPGTGADLLDLNDASGLVASFDSAGNFATTGSATIGNGITVTGGGSILGAFDINGSGTANTSINTGTNTGNVAIGNSTGTFAVSSNTLNINTSGIITGVAGITFTSGNFDQSAATAGTFKTGGGAVSLNGNTTVASGKTVTIAGFGTGVVQSNSSGLLSSSALNLATSGLVTGILPIANGGTNNSSFTTNGVNFYDGTKITSTTAGTAGQVLLANGSAIPTFTTVSGDITIDASGVTTIGAGKVTNTDLQNDSINFANGTNTTVSATSEALGGTAISVSVVSNPTFAGDVTVQGSSGLTVGTGSQVGQLILQDGSGNAVTIAPATQQSGGLSLTIPAETNPLISNDTFCLYTLNNCAGSGASSVGALDGQPKNANGATITSNTLYLQSADATHPGLVTAAAQEFAGAKQFDDLTTLNGGLTESGVAQFTGPAAGSSTAVTINTGADSNVGLVVNGTSSAAADLLRVEVNGNIVSGFNKNGRLFVGSTSGVSGASLYVSQLTASSPLQINRGAVSQTGDLLTFQNSSSTVLGGFNSSGQLYSGDLAGNYTQLAFTNTGTNTITFPAATGTVCLQTSSACGFALSSTGAQAFVQGGNSFGAQAELGTNDGNALAFHTNNADRLILDTSGNLTFQQASTLSVVQASGTTTGSGLSIAAGQGGSGGAAGGVLALQGGAGAGTNQNGGNVTIDGGAATGTGTKGSVILQTGSGRVGIGTASPTSLLSVGSSSQLTVDTGGNLVTSGRLSAGTIGSPATTFQIDAGNNVNSGAAYGIHNNSNGANAFSGYAAYNDNAGTSGIGKYALFGIAGTGYTALSLLQNSAFVLAGANTNGLVLNTQAATPIIFGINNTEAARFSSTGNLLLGNTTGTSLLSVGSSAQFTVDSSGNEITSGTIQYANGTTNTSTAVCRNSSGQLAGCTTSGTGAAFVQGGNSFGAAGDLGTNDNSALNIRTNGTTKLTVSTVGDLTFAQASTIATSTGNLSVKANGTNTLLLDTTGAGTINLGTGSAAIIGIGNAGSTNNVLGTTNINTSGTAATTIGSASTSTNVKLQNNSSSSLTVGTAGTAIVGTLSAGSAGQFSVSTVGNVTINSSINGGNGINLNNTSSGVAAFTGTSFNNGTSSGSVGLAGTGYTIIPLLQNSTFLYSTGNVVVNTGAVKPIIFGINNAEKARFDTSGNFLLGNTTGTSLLSVGSSSQFTVNSSGNTTVALAAAANNTTVCSNGGLLSSCTNSFEPTGGNDFIKNQTTAATIQSANFFFQAAGSTVAATIRGNSTADHDILDLQTGAAGNAIVAKFDASGNLTAGTINGATITSTTFNTATISGGSLSGGTFSGGSVSGGTLTGTAVNSLGVSGTAITATGALSVSSGGSGQLTLSSASGDISTGSNTINGQTISSAANFTGTLAFNTLGSAGTTVLCQNGSKQVSSCSSTFETNTGNDFIRNQTTAAAVQSASEFFQGASGNVTATIRGESGHTADILDLQTGAAGNAIVAKFDKDGNLTAGTINGAAITSTTFNTATISGGSLTGGTFSGGSVSGGTVSGGTLTGTAVNSLGVSGTAITATGALSVSSGGSGQLTLSSATGDISTSSDTINGQTISSAASFSGTLAINTLGSAGSTLLCQNGSKQISSCSSSYETTGGNDFIKNQTTAATIQSANFYFQANGASVAATIRGNSTANQDILDLLGGVSGATVASVDQSGNVLGASFDTQTSSALNIGTTNASSIGLKKSTTVTGNTGVALTVQGVAAQDIADFNTSGGATVAKFDVSGNLTAVGGTFTALTNGGSGGIVQSNGSGALSSSDINIGTSSYITGTLGVNRGGTGVTSFTHTNGLLFAGTSTTGALQNLANGTSGTILKSNGTGSLPSWVTATAANTCTDCVVTDPASAQSIQPTTAVTGLALKSFSSGTAHVLDIYGVGAGSPQDYFDSAGALNLGVTAIPTASGTIDLGSSTKLFRTGYFSTSVLTGTVDAASSGILNLGTSGSPTTTQISLNQNAQLASGKNLSFASGAGSFDQSASSGSFKTGTGIVSLNGSTQVAAGKNLTLLSGNGQIVVQGYGATNSSAESITANSLTTGSFLNLQNSGSAYVGTAILADLAAGGSGTFTGNFVDFQNNDVSQFKVTSDGTIYVQGHQGVTQNSCSSGEVLTGADYYGGIATGGTCSAPSGFVTLQNAYNNSGTTQPQIQIDSGLNSVNGLTISDDGTAAGGVHAPLTGNIFQVTSYNNGGTAYLGVASSGITTSGTLTANGGNPSTIAGQLRATNTTANGGVSIVASGITETNSLKVGGSFQFNVDSSGNISSTGSLALAPGGSNPNTFNVSSNAQVSRTYKSTSSATADSLSAINGSTGSGVSVTGLGITLTDTAGAAGSNTLNGITLGSVTHNTAGNIFNGINFGSGYDNLINGGSVYTVTGAGAVTEGGALTISNGGASIKNTSGNILTLQNTSSSVVTVDNSGNFTAGTYNGQTIGSAASFTGTVAFATLGTANTASYLCYNSSNQIASCNTSGTGAAFVQGGNHFGASTAGILGTLDSGSTLNVVAGGTTQFIVGTNGTLTFDNASNTITTQSTGNNLSIDTFSGATLALGASSGTINLGNTSSTTVAKFTAGAYNLRVTNTGVGINDGGAAPTADLSFGAGADRTINVIQAGSGNGNNLTIQAGSGVGTGTNNGGNLYMQGGAGHGSGSDGSVIVKGTNPTSNAAFQIQNSGGTALLIADTSTNMRVTVGTIGTVNSTAPALVVTKAEIQTGLYVGVAAGNIQNNGSGGALRFAGTARNTIAVTLTPEYAGATMTGDGGSNLGTMTSDFCSNSLGINATICGTSNTHNYYSWTSASASQDYDIWTRWQVPSNFDSTQTFPTINFNGWRTNTSTDVITLNVYNNNSGTACGTISIGGSNGAWATSGNVAAGTCVINPGDVLTLDAHLANGGAGDFVRIGEINISYLANF